MGLGLKNYCVKAQTYGSSREGRKVLEKRPLAGRKESTGKDVPRRVIAHRLCHRYSHNTGFFKTSRHTSSKPVNRAKLRNFATCSLCGAENFKITKTECSLSKTHPKYFTTVPPEESEP